MRVFVSIDIPKQIAEKIKKIQESLPNFIGKKTEQENLHLSLKFLGDVSEERIKDIIKVLGEIRFEKFETIIDSIGVFSLDYVRIVWLHLDNCEKLQSVVDDRLIRVGFEKERRFMSHLTIARVKKVDDRKKFISDIEKVEIPKIKFVVDNFKLRKSTLTQFGPIYETLERYELG